MPIGAYTSQPLGNFVVSALDHYIKQNLKVAYYLRYCDDCVALVNSKAKARKVLREYERIATEMGLVVKINSVVSPIGTNQNGKTRKRKRGKKSRLSRVRIYAHQHAVA